MTARICQQEQGGRGTDWATKEGAMAANWTALIHNKKGMSYYSSKSIVDTTLYTLIKQTQTYKVIKKIHMCTNCAKNECIQAWRSFCRNKKKDLFYNSCP